MRKLKLQMQVSADGFVARPNGELDWMQWNWDDKIKQYVQDIHAPVDCILMGRKMAPGFIPYWEDVLTNKPDHPDFGLAGKMVHTPKVVFSKTLDEAYPQEAGWKNTTLTNGDLVEEVNKLKNQPGQDIITYGGAGFTSSLIENNLIDEYHLFINPAAIGKGLTIFGKVQDKFGLTLEKAQAFDCGVVVLVYTPAGK
jgi:dihydrofolate reductase